MNNSCDAIGRCEVKYDDEYKGFIHINAKIINKNELIIAIKDNGGGFPKAGLIYGTAIPSSKQEGRIGCGTQLVKYFAIMQDIKLSAENYITSRSLRGACTKISIKIGE